MDSLKHRRGAWCGIVMALICAGCSDPDAGDAADAGTVDSGLSEDGGVSEDGGTSEDSGASEETVLVTGQHQIESLAQDADYLYWADLNPENGQVIAIRRIAKSGGEIETIDETT